MNTNKYQSMSISALEKEEARLEELVDTQPGMPLHHWAKQLLILCRTEIIKRSEEIARRCSNVKITK
jgi:hypothetical protein